MVFILFLLKKKFNFLRSKVILKTRVTKKIIKFLM